MQPSPSPAAVRPPPAPPPLVATSGREAELRAELDALNLELRELKSTDLGVRAYAATWLGFLACGVGGKLLRDALVTDSKIAWAVWPLLLLGVLLFADAVAQKLAQRRLQRDEEERLARQRELRRVLGLEEAVLPPSNSLHPDA